VTRLLFIRHGESTWNAAGRWQGQADPPLSDAGRDQAVAAGARLRDRDLTLLASSDLRRAAETAERIGAELGLTPRLVTGLRELDVGVWSGLPHEEIAQRFSADLARFRAGDPDVEPGGGESRRALHQRVTAALAALAAEAPGRVAVVSHLGVLRAVRPGFVLANAEWVELSEGELISPQSRYPHGPSTPL
jgi:broad specificity phosphatase PhoE